MPWTWMEIKSCLSPSRLVALGRSECDDLQPAKDEFYSPEPGRDRLVY